MERSWRDAHGWLRGSWLRDGLVYHACRDVMEGRTADGERVAYADIRDGAAVRVSGWWSRCGLPLDTWRRADGLPVTGTTVGPREVVDRFARPCLRCYPEFRQPRSEPPDAAQGTNAA